jgi:hypothetical protein
MKKLIYILIGIFTFSIGFWLFHFYYDRQVISSPTDTSVTLCEVAGNASFYQSKQIHIKALLDGVGTNGNNLDDFTVFDFKNGCLISASLEIPENVKGKLKSDESLKASLSLLRQKYKEAFDNRQNQSLPAGYYFIEVEIIGEIERHEYQYGVSDPPLPLVIKVNQIKQVSPVRSISREVFSNITKNITNLK